MKKYLLMMLSALIMSTAWAQDRTITGQVTDAESGETIPGANIVEKGTSNGTITDFDGNYRLSVGDGAVLVVSFVGYQTIEIPIGARSTIDISLELDVQALSEVVVVGYGTQTKKEITSAVTSVGPEDFNNGNINSAGQLLQGKVAGLSIVRPGGDPNQEQQIRLRGLTTFGANTQPLIVLDGVVGASLDNVDPNDIASMDVLKDGSAAAIYGARGSSGVILVTTKSGKGTGQQTTVNYNGFVTVDQVANTIDVLSPDEYLARGGQDFGSRTNWFEELTQTGVSFAQNLSVAGSLSPNTSYRASINYRDNQGIVKGVNFQRLNTRLNVNHAALDGRLRLQFNVAANSREQESINLSAFRYAVIYNPTAPILDEADDRFGGYFQRDLFDFYNPVALANQQQFVNERKSILTNYRAEFDIIDDLTFSVNFAQDVQNGIDGSYWSKTDIVRGFGGNGVARRTTFDNQNRLAEATLNYNIAVSDFNISTLLGVASQVRVNQGFGAEARNFLFDDQSFNSLGFAGIRLGNNTDLYSYKEKDILNSVFARVNVTYNNAVFLSASVRREAYSGFGENNKAGFFPAVSAGVELTEYIDLGPVNQLKLRGSYGITGNLPPNPYLALPIFVPGARIDVDGDPLTTGDVFVAPRQEQNPNPELKWETKTEVNVGMDFAMLGGKITGSVDAYRRNIADLLFRVNVPIGAPNPFSPGSINTVGGTWANIADLSAGGLEFVASYNGINLGPVMWTPTVNFTLYQKTQIDNFEVRGLGQSEIRLATPGSPGQNNNEIIRNRVGETIGNMYGPRFLGLNEVGEYVLENPENPDSWGVIGNGLPDGEFGFSNSFVYQNFDFNFFLRGAFGHDIYNSYRGFYENQDAASNTWNSVTTSKTPVVTSSPTFSDLYVEKGTFVRLDNAQLGYRVPLNSKAVSSLRFYLAGQNLFTLTNYTGIDPEVRYNDTENTDGFTTNLAPGIERRNTYFTTRSVTLGVNITFK